ncbi:MAG: hypothetical protein U0457_07580 [Candidatus Sericytochromatia bacterium]
MRVVPIKKVLKNHLGKNKVEKYLKGIEVIFSNKLTANTMDMYQYALSQFAEGETEKAINAIVFILDFDREHKLTLHLCKTMLFGLTQYVMERKDEYAELKKRYENDLDSAISKLKKKVKDIEKIIAEKEKELEGVEKIVFDNRSNFIFNLFKKGKFKSQINEIKNHITTNSEEYNKNKNEVEKIDDMIQKEEYLKVIGLIVEICIFPVRFEQELTKTQWK